MSVGCRVCKIVPAASPATTDPDTTKKDIIASVPLTVTPAPALSNVSTIATAAPTPAVQFGLEATEKVTVSPATYPSPGLLTTYQ